MSELQDSEILAYFFEKILYWIQSDSKIRLEISLFNLYFVQTPEAEFVIFSFSNDFQVQFSPNSIYFLKEFPFSNQFSYSLGGLQKDAVSAFFVAVKKGICLPFEKSTFLMKNDFSPFLLKRDKRAYK